MSTKAELKKEHEVTREVKEDEQKVADAVKDTVHDAKEGAKDLAEKTSEMSIKDAPKVLLPSAKSIDKKLEGAQENLEDLSHAKRHNVDMDERPKLQELIHDTQNILQDERDILRAKTKDGALGDAVQRTANIGQIAYDQSWAALDHLWSNWASLLTVVAAGSAGSWKSILEQSGRLVNDLRHTQDFVKLLNDLQTAFFALYNGAQKGGAVDDKINAAGAEWEKQRDLLVKDVQNCYTILSKSPIWNKLVAQGKALKKQTDKVVDETKKEFEGVGEAIADSKDADKLKDDLKKILQSIIGANGPSVEPFLNYASAAWEDVTGNEASQKWAEEMDNLLTTVTADSDKMNQAAYEKQYEELYNSTKELLDSTIQNENLRLAMRESKKLVKSAKADPATKKLIKDASSLVKHITASKGTNILDPQLLEELRGVLVPILVDHFDNAPLPDYEGKDSNALGKYEYKLSGIRLGTTGLVPSKIKIEFRYKMVADPSKLEVQQQRMFMYLEIDDIQVAFKDVKWEYNRLTVPRFSDSGAVDLSTAGKGICLKVKAEIENYKAPEHAHSFSELLEEPKENKMFKILTANCLIDDFHVNVSEAGGASVFYEMLAGIWGNKIKHQIEHQVERKLYILASKFNSELYDIVRRATAPSLLTEAKDTLSLAGHVGGEKLVEVAQGAKEEVKAQFLSM